MQFRITPISSVAVVGLGVALLSAACGGPTAPDAAPVAATASAVSSTTVPPSSIATAVSSSLISIKGAWARSTPGNPNENSAGYAQVTNNATQMDRLVAASVPESFAKTVELHRTVRAGEVMRMEPVQSFEIAPGATLTLEPGGNHIMLLNLPTALKPGTKVPVTLRFERAAPLTVELGPRGDRREHVRHRHAGDGACDWHCRRDDTRWYALSLVARGGEVTSPPRAAC